MKQKNNAMVFYRVPKVLKEPPAHQELMANRYVYIEYEFVLLWNNRKLLHETENENDDSKLFSVHVRTSHHRRL